MALARYLKPLRLLTGAVAVLVLHSASDAATGPSADLIKVSHLTGPIYVVEDENIFSENSVFYVGRTTVTLIGTGWSPEIAALIDTKIKAITEAKLFQFNE